MSSVFLYLAAVRVSKDAAGRLGLGMEGKDSELAIVDGILCSDSYTSIVGLVPIESCCISK